VKPFILVVDDEPDIRTSVKDILEDEGYLVDVAASADDARRCVGLRHPDLILLDIWMPDVDGITLLKELFADFGITTPVVMMSGHGTVETAVEATRLGAKDFIEKPLSLAKLLHTVEDALADGQSKGAVVLQQSAATIAPVGKSAQILHLREQLERIAQHPATVLFSGEPGSGKTFCAKYLHARGPHKQGPFIDVHTRQFQDGQGGVLLLGQETDDGITPGYLELAQGGSLFLDDIAELDLGLQQSLYAALSTGQWVRVNGAHPLNLNLQLMAATRYNLEQEVHAGRFHPELYHMLKGMHVHVPALREHAEDVTELLDYYINQLVDKENYPYRTFSVAAQNRLRHYQWPGNIRELEALVRRLLVLGLDTKIELDEVEASLSGFTSLSGNMQPEFDLPLRQARELFEKTYLEFHLREADWNVGKVAKEVGMERTHLYRKLRSLGIASRREAREK
jgi:two-component system nitrogen regulation response regulator NtrX